MAEPIGPTGETPITKTPGDRGGLQASVRAVEGLGGDLLIRVDFGTSLSYVVMTALEARAFAETLTSWADRVTEGNGDG